MLPLPETQDLPTGLAMDLISDEPRGEQLPGVQVNILATMVTLECIPNLEITADISPLLRVSQPPGPFSC